MPSVLKQFDLSGRLALVTGSSAGIGLALAQGLAGAGAAVVLNGRRADKLDEAAAALRAQGATVHAMPFDVGDAAAVAAAVARIEAEIGEIDILINNAGMQRRAPLQDFAQDDWRELMRTNLDSVFIVGQAVARHMIPRGRGKIVNICSVQSELGRPGIAPYTASKGAVKMLTKGMAIDWGPYGLQVNGLGPGYFKTELNQALVDNPEFSAWLIGRTPSRRWGDVEDLVGAAVFLASDASRFVNGHILYVDGGVTATL
ncbi:MAG: glucose 1-dehydrogenase [Rubrivivax sp.]|nr:glucose 1-dehydrogenase [Rubrivivax sp.]